MTEDLPGRVTDPLALRALSHPLRWKLLELIRLEETATATRCAEQTGESVASCSYHLGILAKYGFVELADAAGRGREKPWRASHRRLSVSSEGLDPEAAMASEAVSEVFLDHEVSRIKEHMRRSSREPEDWRQAVGIRGRLAHLTAEELRALLEEFDAMAERYVERTEDRAKRPPGSRPVRLLLASHLPVPLPPDADDTPETDTTTPHDEEDDR